MSIIDRIEVNSKVAFGKPVISGTRIAVEFVLQLLASGWTVSDILSEYPNLKNQDILACLNYAHQLVSQWSVLAFPQYETISQ